MYICLTYVDAATGIPCTEAPMAHGPTFPDVKGLEVKWWNETEWPTDTPLFYGTCDEGADTTVPGVLEVLSEARYLNLREAETGLKAFQVRNERNQRVAQAQSRIDKLLRRVRMGMPADALPEWDDYVQALADVPEQAGFPFDVEWPTAPDANERNWVVTPFQAKAALLDAGLLDDIEALMADLATDRTVVLAWNNVTEFRRLSPMVAGIASALGWSDEQLDGLFEAAALKTA